MSLPAFNLIKFEMGLGVKPISYNTQVLLLDPPVDRAHTWDRKNKIKGYERSWLLNDALTHFALGILFSDPAVGSTKPFV